MTDLRAKGHRVLYTAHDDGPKLGSTLGATSLTNAGCTVVRFDDVPFTWVIPVEDLKAVSREDENDFIAATNALAFEKLRQVLNEAQQSCAYDARAYDGVGRARVAKISIDHTDFAGHDETWRITVSAKSRKPKGL